MKAISAVNQHVEDKETTHQDITLQTKAVSQQYPSFPVFLVCMMFSRVEFLGLYILQVQPEKLRNVFIEVYLMYVILHKLQVYSTVIHNF